MFSNLNRLQIVILVLIIVSAVLTGLLAFVNARTEASAKQRINDVQKITEALDIYFDVNGFYPLANDGKPSEIEFYLDFYPSPPHADDDACSQNTYKYEQRLGGEDYLLSFCLSGVDKTLNSKGTSL